MANPLLTPQEQAHIDNIRANHSTLPPYAENATQGTTGVLAYLKTRDYSKAFPYATNGIALAFVGFYLLTFASIAGDGNHIYTVYRLFPIIASVAITAALWRLPDNSLMRVFYLMGLFTVSWLGA